MAATSLLNLFNPQTIAVLGASTDERKFSGRIVPYLVRHGFKGKIYPINKKAERVHDVQAYPELDDVPTNIDCLIFAVPFALLASMMPSFAAKGVKLLVITSAPSNPEHESAAYWKHILDLAERGGMRILGPNCIGFANFEDGVAATAAIAMMRSDPPSGGIGLVTQSGGLGFTTIAHYGFSDRYGFSYIINTGNERDLTTVEISSALVDDDATDVIALTIEAVKDLTEFTDFLDKAARAGKPVVILKSGRTPLGRQMAASHTGALAGDAKTFEFLCDRYGVTVVYSLLDFYLTSAMFGKLRRAGKLTSGDTGALSISGYSISGGHVGLFADHISSAGFKLEPLSQPTRALAVGRLGIPESLTNPLDMTARVIGDDAVWGDIARILTDDPSYNIIVPIITIANSYEAAIAEFAKIDKETDKLIIVVWAGTSYTDSDRELLGSSCIPAFPSSETLAQALVKLAEYRKFCLRLREADSSASISCGKDAVTNDLLEAHLVALGEQSVYSITEGVALQLWADAGIPCADEKLYKYSSELDLSEIVRSSSEIGYPVVVKIDHPDLPHKSDLNLVKTDVKGHEELKQAVGEVLRSYKAHVSERQRPGGRLLVQKQIAGRLELLVGVTEDPEFGMVLVIGFGGIYTEVIQDVVSTPLPVSRAEISDLIKKLKFGALLTEVRGKPAPNVDQLVDLISNFANECYGLHHLIKDAELNPVIYDERESKSWIAVDALINLKREDAKG